MSTLTELIAPVAQRIEQDVMELATICDSSKPGWTRQVFSEPYREAREWVTVKMRDCGLDVHQDEAGNIIGVLHGTRPEAPALVTGSHTDTVVGGGRFDGTVGVLGGLELVRQFHEHDASLTRDLVVIDFLGEESNDFGLSCLGSRALAGELAASDLDRRDAEGVRLGDRYAEFGLDPAQVVRASWTHKTSLHCYLELHVEQGPLLEQRGASIGVVTAIAGIERLLATFEGRPDHAGTRPMGDRRDALVAAANAVLAVQRQGCGAPVHGVATTTRLTSQPGSPNVVPGTVQMRAEMRSVDAGWLSAARHRLAEDIRDKALEDGVEVDLEWTTDNARVGASRGIQDVVAKSAESLGLTWEAVPSGATHDAVHLASLCPMGMIFIPSLSGRSHCPEEWSDFVDISAGVNVLAASLLSIDHKGS